MSCKVSTCVEPELRPTPLTLLPAALPDSIGQLQALKRLYANGNNIAGTCFCSTNSPLTLACTELPSTIGNLKALKTLSVHMNALKGEHSRSTNCPIVRPTPHALVPAALPSTIGNLKALVSAALLSTIGNLKALEYLDVEENALEGEHLRSTNSPL